MKQESLVDVSVLWRGRQLKVATDSISDVKEFGLKLLELTKIKADTMKLLIPLPSNKGSKLLTPFSPEHVNLSLREAGILEGKPIRMMGVFEDEVEEVSQNNLKPDLRIIGFEEEEKRTRQRLLDRPEVSLKLPQGVFIFCDFRTLHIPGIELNPPASEALRRMHMLACDPGIIAIMNKHCWRVGIMTELAPVGYVGISPKCLLGFNKNHGEEISLRLRTDDLKGFRKYESIKKTLLHELAHMVHSEHDANFFALNKQLNEEAASLDWTKSRSHTLRGQKISKHYDDEFLVESTNYSTGQKLGGLALMASTSARASSVAAAYNRFVYSSTSSMEESQTDVKIKTGNTSRAVEKLEAIAAVEPDPDASMVELEYESGTDEPDPDDALLVVKDKMQIDHPTRPIVAVSSTKKIWDEPDPDDSALDGRTPEPDHDDSQNDEARSHCEEPDPDDPADISEPDPDDQANRTEPDPDDLETVKDGGHMKLKYFGEVHGEPDSNDCKPEVMLLDPRGQVEHNPDEALQLKFTCPEPDPDDKMAKLDSQELQRIEEPVAAICRRIEKAIKMLRSETTPLQAISSLQTLSKIIKNVIEHPDNAKFQRLRKGNALFQKNVANYKAAMEVLTVVGFCEDIVMDGIGRSETYMVLKRNDPGLLWLAKSSLEVSIA